MTPTFIFILGVFVSLLCLTFAVVSILEVRRAAREAERLRGSKANKIELEEDR